MSNITELQIKLNSTEQLVTNLETELKIPANRLQRAYKQEDLRSLYTEIHACLKQVQESIQRVSGSVDTRDLSSMKTWTGILQSQQDINTRIQKMKQNCPAGPYLFQPREGCLEKVFHQIKAPFRSCQRKYFGAQDLAQDTVAAGKAAAANAFRALRLQMIAAGIVGGVCSTLMQSRKYQIASLAITAGAYFAPRAATFIASKIFGCKRPKTIAHTQ